MRGYRLPLAERFAAKHQPCAQTGCWLWTDAPGKNGYGRLYVNGKVRLAHQLSYELHVGPIGDGLCVCHRCDVRSCVNPDHLFLGTVAENIADMVEKGRHARGSSRRQARLSEADVLNLRARIARGERVRPVREAKAFGVSTSRMSRILRGLAWTHVSADQLPLTD